jgi:hypothetical protein
LGFAAFDRGRAGGRGAAAVDGGGVAAFGAGAGFAIDLGGFGGLATTTAFGLGFAAAFFAVLGPFTLRALAFFDGLAFFAAARVRCAFLSCFGFPDALALLRGALALRARLFARRDRGGAFFLRVVRETAFLAEARRVLDLAIARGPFSRRRLTKCR